MGNPEDQAVIEDILSGDSDAYAILVMRYQKAIYNLMVRMTGSGEDAADLTQETFIKAYEGLSRFQKGRRFFPWLYTIGLNHSKNFLRRRCLLQTDSVEDCELESGLDYPAQQEDVMYARLDAQRLQAVLNQLPVDYREALILRYHEGCTMEDIAEALNLSVSGAKMRVHRGLQKIRKLLGDGPGTEADLDSAVPDPIA